MHGVAPTEEGAGEGEVIHMYMRASLSLERTL
jgi:hypothetical protein